MKIILLDRFNTLLENIGKEARDAEGAIIAVAFMKPKATKLLFGKLRKMLIAKRPVSFYTCSYMQITDPRALDFLISNAKKSKNISIYFNQKSKFHAKFLYFQKPNNEYAVFIGSSNVSDSGLREEGELNVEVMGSRGKKDKFHASTHDYIVNNLKENEDFEPITRKADITDYRKTFKVSGTRKPEKSPRISKSKNTPPKIEQRTLPIIVYNRRYEPDKEKKIREEHEEWGDECGGSSRDFKGLNAWRDFFLAVNNLEDEKKTCEIKRYIREVRVAGVGDIVHFKSGKKIPMKNFADEIGISASDLLKEKSLDSKEIGIINRVFKDKLPSLA